MPSRVEEMGAVFLEPLASLLSTYDFIGQFHLPLSSSGSRSHAHAYDSLLGCSSDGAMMDKIISVMTKQPNIGLVIPAVAEISGWGKSRATADFLSRRIGMERLPNAIEYPLENMFWMRNSIFAHCLRLKMSVDDFPLITTNNGSSISKTLPKFLYVLVRDQGLRTGVAKIDGSPRIN
jgi:lipopolysaccharide biosynthesis protein